MTQSIHNEITDKIIEAMQSEHEWQSGIAGLHSGLPVNNNGKHYSGVNILLLWLSGHKNGYTGNQWMTYKQAQARNAQVRKGEKGTRIIFYKTLEKERDNGNIDHIPMLKCYSVFNIDQIDGLNNQDNSPRFTWNPIEAGESLLQSSECPVNTANRVPCYVPSEDAIYLPDRTQFNTPENYYTTLAHEMAHSTGHKSRLNRLDAKNKRDYAFEELIAELASVFACAQIGIKGQIENHASYLKNWLKAMESDKKYIFQAATMASKASDYLINNVNCQQAVA